MNDDPDLQRFTDDGCPNFNDRPRQRGTLTIGRHDREGVTLFDGRTGERLGTVHVQVHTRNITRLRFDAPGIRVVRNELL